MQLHHRDELKHEASSESQRWNLPVEMCQRCVGAARLPSPRLNPLLHVFRGPHDRIQLLLKFERAEKKQKGVRYQ